MQPEETKPEETQAEETQQEALSPEDIKKHAQQFAEALGETDAKPMGQIEQLIEKCGLDFVKKLMEETEKIEAKEGIKTHDRKRRRTKGGVFFFLAKGRMDAKIRQDIFPNFGKHADGDVTPMGIDWENRAEHIKPLLEEPGQVNNLSIKLIGRPGKVEVEGGTVMTVIEQKEVKSPPYPKGVPPFEDVEKITYYYVFMSLKHWSKVESYMEDETDMLIIEGTAVFDPALDGISILTTRLSTKLMERQKRLNADQKEKQDKSDKKKDKGKGKPAKATKGNNTKKPTSKAPVQSRPERDFSDLPTSVSDKLKQLHSAADTLRQKIETMEEEGKKSGLNMTRRLLEQTEKQIATLEKQYDK